MVVYGAGEGKGTEVETGSSVDQPGNQQPRRISEPGSWMRTVDGRTAERYLQLAMDGFTEIGLEIDRQETEELLARLKQLRFQVLETGCSLFIQHPKRNVSIGPFPLIVITPRISQGKLFPRAGRYLYSPRYTMTLFPAYDVDCLAP